MMSNFIMGGEDEDEDKKMLKKREQRSESERTAGITELTPKAPEPTCCWEC